MIRAIYKQDSSYAWSQNIRLNTAFGEYSVRSCLLTSVKQGTPKYWSWNFRNSLSVGRTTQRERIRSGSWIDLYDSSEAWYGRYSKEIRLKRRQQRTRLKRKEEQRAASSAARRMKLIDDLRVKVLAGQLDPILVIAALVTEVRSKTIRKILKSKLSERRNVNFSGRRG